jgi:hypothetical protein
MFNEIPLMIHLIILLSIPATVGGLWLGLSIRRSDIDDGLKVSLTCFGFFIAIIFALILCLNPSILPIGYEFGGLSFCLSLLISFIGLGLCFGPARGPRRALLTSQTDD